tara:strand:- start:2900 stop:3703 length:804 start_codon:yes stop_codon:yes gene_type:complete
MKFKKKYMFTAIVAAGLISAPATYANPVEDIVNSVKGAVQEAIPNANGGGSVSDPNTVINTGDMLPLSTIEETTEYKTVSDQFGKNVHSSSDNIIGYIEDILIDPATGDVDGYVLRANDINSNNKMKIVIPEDILYVKDTGEVKTRFESAQSKNYQPFSYYNLNKHNGVSAKILLEGKIVNEKDEVIGDIQEIEFEDNKASSLVFNHEANEKTYTMSMNFKDLKIFYKDTGYKILFTQDDEKILKDNLPFKISKKGTLSNAKRIKVN